MTYRLVHKSRLVIFDELSIPIPMSHAIDGNKSIALEWMFERGMQRECEVMSEAQFLALNGRCSK